MNYKKAGLRGTDKYLDATTDCVGTLKQLKVSFLFSFFPGPRSHDDEFFNGMHKRACLYAT